MSKSGKKAYSRAAYYVQAPIENQSAKIFFHLHLLIGGQRMRKSRYLDLYGEMSQLGDICVQLKERLWFQGAR